MILRRPTAVRLAVVASVIAFAGLGTRSARAAGSLRGLWRSPAGAMRVTRKGTHVVGRLVHRSRTCGLAAGARVLDGDLLLGNLTGKLRLCAPGCPQGRAPWGFAMLVRRGGRLSGAVHVDVGRCKVVGRSAKGGVVLTRLPSRRHPSRKAARARARPRAKGAARPAPDPDGASPPAPDDATAPDAAPGPETYDPRHAGEARSQAMDIARAGLDLMQRGRFEEARKRFLAAVAKDPAYAEGYNGVGVTYAMRRDWKSAVGWYQKSIAANPDIGDAYYNLACAYAQTHQAVLAVRYLRLAVLNGYSQVKQIAQDPDLAPLRGRSDYRAVLALGGGAP